MKIKSSELVSPSSPQAAAAASHGSCQPSAAPDTFVGRASARSVKKTALTRYLPLAAVSLGLGALARQASAFANEQQGFKHLQEQRRAYCAQYEAFSWVVFSENRCPVANRPQNIELFCLENFGKNTIARNPEPQWAGNLHIRAYAGPFPIESSMTPDRTEETLYERASCSKEDYPLFESLGIHPFSFFEAQDRPKANAFDTMKNAAFLTAIVAVAAAVFPRKDKPHTELAADELA